MGGILETATGATRTEILEAELMARGMQAREARALSWRIATRHPLARRLGIHRLAGELWRLGLDPEQARSTSRTLLALELREHGYSHAVALEVLRAEESGDGEVTCAALDAARLHRALQSARLDVPPTWAQVAAASIWVAIVTLSLTVAAYLMGS